MSTECSKSFTHRHRKAEELLDMVEHSNRNLNIRSIICWCRNRSNWSWGSHRAKCVRQHRTWGDESTVLASSLPAMAIASSPCHTLMSASFLFSSHLSSCSCCCSHCFGCCPRRQTSAITLKNSFTVQTLLEGVVRIGSSKRGAFMFTSSMSFRNSIWWVRCWWHRWCWWNHLFRLILRLRQGRSSWQRRKSCFGHKLKCSMSMLLLMLQGFKHQKSSVWCRNALITRNKVHHRLQLIVSNLRNTQSFNQHDVVQLILGHVMSIRNNGPFTWRGSGGLFWRNLSIRKAWWGRHCIVPHGHIALAAVAIIRLDTKVNSPWLSILGSTSSTGRRLGWCWGGSRWARARLATFVILRTNEITTPMSNLSTLSACCARLQRLHTLLSLWKRELALDIKMSRRRRCRRLATALALGTFEALLEGPMASKEGFSLSLDDLGCILKSFLIVHVKPLWGQMSKQLTIIKLCIVRRLCHVIRRNLILAVVILSLVRIRCLKDMISFPCNILGLLGHETRVTWAVSIKEATVLAFATMTMTPLTFVNMSMLCDKFIADGINRHHTSQGWSHQKLMVFADTWVHQNLLGQYELWKLELVVQTCHCQVPWTSPDYVRGHGFTWLAWQNATFLGSSLVQLPSFLGSLGFQGRLQLR